jgi:hypothetical protein
VQTLTVAEDAVQEKVAGVRREKLIVENQEEAVAIKKPSVIVSLRIYYFRQKNNIFYYLYNE